MVPTVFSAVSFSGGNGGSWQKLVESSTETIENFAPKLELI